MTVLVQRHEVRKKFRALHCSCHARLGYDGRMVRTIWLYGLDWRLLGVWIQYDTILMLYGVVVVGMFGQFWDRRTWLPRK